MVEHDIRITHTSGIAMWRAGCGGSRTSGSEGGPEKPTSRKADRAPRSDPYTYVATWSGFAYVAFITDVYSRCIVGWNVAATLKADILPLQALEIAAWDAGGDLEGVTHRSDHGSNYLSIIYTDRIVELGAKPSTGTVGDSFDNGLAETVNEVYKTELIRRRGPWRTIEQVELATLEWV